MISGDLDHLKSDEPAAASTAWPLGLMVVVVFVVCLAIWAVVITYFTHL